MQTFIFTLQHDTGTTKLSTRAQDLGSARSNIMKAEGCPPTAISKIERKGSKLIPLTFDQLEPGKEYLMHSTQFRSWNKIRMICFDYTPLKRRLANFQYTERGYKILTAGELEKQLRANITPDAFCLWEFNLKTDLIYPL